jgi:hypothetical protein
MSEQQTRSGQISGHVRRQAAREIAARILALAEAAKWDPSIIGTLSTGETLAVAMVLDRRDLFPGYTMLEATERLGPEWTAAAFRVQRAFPRLRAREV